MALLMNCNSESNPEYLHMRAYSILFALGSLLPLLALALAESSEADEGCAKFCLKSCVDFFGDEFVKCASEKRDCDCDSDPPKHKKSWGLSKLWIVLGISAGTILLCCLPAWILCCMIRNRRRRVQPHSFSYQLQAYRHSIQATTDPRRHSADDSIRRNSV